MKNLKALMEKRAEKQNQLDAIVAKADAEVRAVSDEERAEFEKLEKEIKDIDTTLAMEERARGIDKKPAAAPVEERAALEERAFADYLRGVVSENRADINLTTTDNGAVIPSTIASKIIKKVVDTCPIYALATRYNVKGMLNIPYYDETTQSITMAYATEFTELESTSGKFATIELKGFLAGVLSKISKSLINNSQFDIVSFVVSDMGEKIALFIENELLNGTTDKVTGLKGATQLVTAAAASAVTADELIDVQETVHDVYQANAIWIMSRATRTAIRKLKDGQGNYLLNKDASARWGYTLFGKDVYVSAKMPDMAAGKIAIYYGDMTGLAVKVSEDINIEVLREKYATQHAVGVVGWIELDSKLENAQKIAKLVMKAV